MVISTIRVLIARLLQGFAFGVLLAQGFLHTKRSDFSIDGPDPAHGLLYPCYPKFKPWYYADHTIVRSWDFVACAALMIFSVLITLGIRTNIKTIMLGLKTKATYADPLGVTIPGFIAGLVLAFVFVSQAESGVIDWLMQQGFRPPAIACSPVFAG